MYSSFILLTFNQSLKKVKILKNLIGKIINKCYVRIQKGEKKNLTVLLEREGSKIVKKASRNLGMAPNRRSPCLDIEKEDLFAGKFKPTRLPH